MSFSISITITLDLSPAELETLDRSIAEGKATSLAKDLEAAGIPWGREEEITMLVKHRIWEIRRLHQVHDNMIRLRAQEIGGAVMGEQYDLIALEQEILADLCARGAKPEEVMAAMLNVEAMHAQLAAYAVTWDATVAAMRQEDGRHVQA